MEPSEKTGHVNPTRIRTGSRDQPLEVTKEILGADSEKVPLIRITGKSEGTGVVLSAFRCIAGGTTEIPPNPFQQITRSNRDIPDGTIRRIEPIFSTEPKAHHRRYSFRKYQTSILQRTADIVIRCYLAGQICSERVDRQSKPNQ
jgi:hypothetical protein